MEVMAPSEKKDEMLEEEEKGNVSALEEEEVDVGQAQQPDEEQGVGNGNGGLPFSKARCVALVLTVAGAAFLNVSLFGAYILR